MCLVTKTKTKKLRKNLLLASNILRLIFLGLRISQRSLTISCFCHIIFYSFKRHIYRHFFMILKPYYIVSFVKKKKLSSFVALSSRMSRNNCKLFVKIPNLYLISDLEQQMFNGMEFCVIEKTRRGRPC